MVTFETQEKAGFNSQGHYQFGSNSCIGCKADRPLKEEGMYCGVCTNPSNFREKLEV